MAVGDRRRSVFTRSRTFKASATPMGITATLQLGHPPHPSIALIERDWLKSATAYVELQYDGKSLGVLRVLDSGIRSQDQVFVDPKAWLSHVPDADSKIVLETVGKEEYTKW